MQKVIKSGIALALVIGLTGIAHAQSPQFTQPTPSQIAAAAANPSLLTSLLAQATPEQAAEIVRRVLVAISAQAVTPEVQAARIQSVMQVAFTTVPPANRSALASALGSSIGSDPVLSLTQGLVSAVQAGVASFSGPEVNLGQVFGTSFVAAQTASGNGGSGNKPTPPPVAEPYAGQTN